jgi:hypothetical protein
MTFMLYRDMAKLEIKDLRISVDKKYLLSSLPSTNLNRDRHNTGVVPMWSGRRSCTC